MFRATINNQEVIRPYTPTSAEQAKGHVDFVIKDYPTGVMSRHIHTMKVGETMDIKGPFEKYNWDKKPVEQVGMVAGKGIQKKKKFFSFTHHEFLNYI